MVILGYICIILGAFLFYIGWKAKGGFLKLFAMKDSSNPRREMLWRLVGNRIMLLGFIGLVAGVAQVLMDKDSIWVFLAYLGFIGLMFLMLRYMVQQWDTGPQKK
jgi:hypothetical protein